MNVVKLSEICIFSRGLTYSKSDEVDFSKNVVLRANNIDLDSNSLNLEDLRYIKDSIEIKKEKIVKKHSLIICTASGSKNHVGKVALITEDLGYAFGGFMGQLTPNDNCHPKFLYYILTSSLFKDFLMSLNDGTNINNLKFSDIENYELPLPNLEKQREIVEKLDSAFAEIDLLERNLGSGDEKANQLLQSLLSSAFSSTADENDLSNNSGDKTNASKLVSLGDACKVINGGTPDTKNSKFWDGEHAWITPAEMGNLKSPYLLGSKRTLTDEGLSNSSAQLVPKHSVIMSSRAPIGHLVINEIPMASNQGCKGMIPNKNLNYKYLYYFLYANKQYLNELGSGTTFAEISGSKLKTVLIPLPSLEKQSEVVEKLDKVFSEIELLKAQIGIEKDYAVALRQSLLSSAFTQEVAVA
jgi:type I restriction enzyme S subunit